MFTIYCKERKEGSEKSIDYNLIFVKLHVCIYIGRHRKHTQVLRVVNTHGQQQGRLFIVLLCIFRTILQASAEITCQRLIF